MSKLTNALTMLNVLSARSVVGLDELSEMLEISTRGVQRLRDELESIGYQIETVKGPGGGYQLKSNAQIYPLAFSLEERKKVRQALSILLQQSAPSLGHDVVGAVSKLSNQLDYSDVSRTLSYQSVKLNVDVDLYQKHLQVIELACESHTRIKIAYQKNHQVLNHYTFEPYEVILVNQFWYVMGYDQKGRYLSLKVNRIVSIEVLDTQFRYDSDTSHREVLSEYGYKIKPVRVQLRVEGLDYLSEYIWGKYQEIEWIDHHVFLLSVEFPNELALKDFVLKGGSHIKVMKPSWLVTWILEELKQIERLYIKE